MHCGGSRAGARRSSFAWLRLRLLLRPWRSLPAIARRRRFDCERGAPQRRGKLRAVAPDVADRLIAPRDRIAFQAVEPLDPVELQAQRLSPDGPHAELGLGERRVDRLDGIRIARRPPRSERAGAVDAEAVEDEAQPLLGR